MVPQCCVYTDKALFANFHSTGNHHMGSDEAVIFNRGMVSYMVSAPQGDIIADGDKRLDGIVFQDKAIAPNPAII